MRTWLARLAILLLLLVVLFHPGRVAIKTLLLLPDMFPTSPVRPLTWLTAPPRVEGATYAFPAGRIDADLYLPAGGGRHGAVILLLGAVGFPRRDPVLVRFADGLSRAGAVVVVPESSNLQQGEILPGEVDGLLLLLAKLRARPEVDPARIGFLGFSVGGSLALLTASSDRGREQVAFVNAFGAYYDADTLLADISSRSQALDGQIEPWAPADLTIWVFSKQLIEPLADPADRDILRKIYLDGRSEAVSELDRLTPDGQLVRELLDGASRPRVATILTALPAAVQARLDGISPSRSLPHLRAHLYLMHDRSDSYIPFTQSRLLAAAAPPGVLRGQEEFDLFAHVLPSRSLDGLELVRELCKLYRIAWLMCLELL